MPRSFRSALAALLVLALLPACAEDEAPAGPPGGGPGGAAVTPSVEVVKARYGALPLEERLSGSVRAGNQIAIYPEISATVLRVTAQSGDRVQQGAPLVYLRDTQYSEQLRQAEASLQIAQAEAKRAEANLQELRARLERTEQLAEQQYQSQQELGTLRAQVTGAEAGYEQAIGRIAQVEATIEEAREALRQTVVRAPISGHVGQRNVEVGMRVDGSTRLFTLGNLDDMRVEVAVTDDMLGRIQAGQTALVSAPNMGGRVVRAEVTRISPFLEEGSYSAEAEIDVSNAEGFLRPGMFVTVDILYGESEQATLVPTSALYEHPDTGVLGVFVAPSLGVETPVEAPETFDESNPPPLSEPTPVAFREIDVIARGREMAGVAGVRPGDWVVTVGQNLLHGDDVHARARPVPWNRIADLQRLQNGDLLRQFLDKQQRLADSRFSEERAPEAAPTNNPEPANTAARPATAARPDTTAHADATMP